MEKESEKTYVQVEARFGTSGDVHPICVIWSDGTRYAVDSILDIRPGVSIITGAAGMRYTVLIGSRVACLYRSGMRWFVEPKKHSIHTIEISV